MSRLARFRSTENLLNPETDNREQASPMFDDDELLMTAKGGNSPIKNSVEHPSNWSPFTSNSEAIRRIHDEMTTDFNEKKQILSKLKLETQLLNLKGIFRRALCGRFQTAFYKWRLNADLATQHLQANLSASPKLQSNLLSLAKTLGDYTKRRIKRALMKWKLFKLIKGNEGSFTASKNQEEKTHRQNLNKITSQVNSLMTKQTELEKQISYMMQKERSYQQEIEALKSSNNYSSSFSSPDKSAEQTLLKLERENQELIERIEATESNISGFMKEMSGILDEEGLKELSRVRSNGNMKAWKR